MKYLLQEVIMTNDIACYRDAWICAAADGFTSFYGGFVIFSVIGYMAKEANMDIKDVATSGIWFFYIFILLQTV